MRVISVLDSFVVQNSSFCAADPGFEDLGSVRRAVIDVGGIQQRTGVAVDDSIPV
jgi:hypothetical protein